MRDVEPRFIGIFKNSPKSPADLVAVFEHPMGTATEFGMTMLLIRDRNVRRNPDQSAVRSLEENTKGLNALKEAFSKIEKMDHASLDDYKYWKDIYPAHQFSDGYKGSWEERDNGKLVPLPHLS